jgi:hypothetical protein
MLQQVQAMYPECNTTAGKDYAIIWLDTILQHGPQPDWTHRRPNYNLLAAVRSYLAEHLKANPRDAIASLFTGAASAALKSSQQRESGSAEGSGSSDGSGGSSSSDGSGSGSRGTHSSSGGSGGGNSSSSSRQDHSMQRQQYHPQDRLREVVTLPYYPGLTTPAHHMGGLLRWEEASQSPFMAVYRSGSVVFGGLGEKEELWWLSQLVPPAVRYTGEDGSPWTKGVFGWRLIREGSKAGQLLCFCCSSIVCLSCCVRMGCCCKLSGRVRPRCTVKVAACGDTACSTYALHRHNSSRQPHLKPGLPNALISMTCGLA